MRQIHVADDDVLVYLHIPKTAGSSLISILDQQFERNEVFPFHSVSEMPSSHEFPLDAHKRYKLVRGHFRLGPFDRYIYGHIVQTPLVFTLLRDPVERTLSAFRHIWRHDDNALHARFVSQHVTLLDFVRKPEFASRVVNHQARQIAGAFVPRPFQWASNDSSHQQILLHIALEKLAQFCFVGLTERFAESVQLMARRFDWSISSAIPELNRAPAPSRKEELTEEELGAIEEVTEADRHVYEVAQRRFATEWEEELGSRSGRRQGGDNG